MREEFMLTLLDVPESEEEEYLLTLLEVEENAETEAESSKDRRQD